MQTFQSLVNRVLDWNPHYLDHLGEVAGLSVAIEFTDLPFRCRFVFRHSYIEVDHHTEAADLLLTGRLIDFIAFAAQKDKRQILLQEERIRFSGELMLLEKIERFLRHFNFRALRFIPVAKIKQFLQNQREYWQEERQVLAAPALFDYLQDELLDLQQELDRVEARIQALEVSC